MFSIRALKRRDGFTLDVAIEVSTSGVVGLFGRSGCGKTTLVNIVAGLLTAVRLTTERDETVNAHAWYDTGQAVGFLVLQATGMGLSIRQMEGFDHERARAACQVPPPFEPAVLR